MKAIKISDKSYEYLKRRSEEDRRPMTTVLDLIIEGETNDRKNNGARRVKRTNGVR